MTKIVQELVSRTKNPGSQFLHMTIYDIVDVFCDAKNTNVRDKDLISIKEYGYNKNSKINTHESCYYLLDMLILKGVIKQEIELKPWKEGSSSLVDSHYIVRIMEIVTDYIENNNWYQLLKPNKKK